MYGRPYDESPDNPKNADDDYGMGEYKNADMLLASSVFTAAEYAMLLDEMAGYVDSSNIIDVISNGRITIFKSYIQELNMWGHEEMGAMLPNGEIAVHAHNTYLQVAYDHGIVAGALFVIVLSAGLFCSIGYYRKNRDKEPLSLMTCGVIIGFAVAGISEWVFQYGNPMTVALMLALAPLTYKVYER
jgi:O-antigen ligase